MSIARRTARHFSYYRDDASIGAYNPNEAVDCGRYVRVIPLGGAAMYPVFCQVAGGGLEVFYGPDFHDLGKPGRIAVKPRGFVEAFAPAPTTITAGNTTQQAKASPVAIAVPPNMPKGWPVPSGGSVGTSVFISGDFAFESCDNAQECMIAQPAPSPSGLWVACKTMALPNNTTALDPADSAVPFEVPDYSSGIVFSGANATRGIFLGCGARRVRYTFFDPSGANVYPALMTKRILGPFWAAPKMQDVLTLDPTVRITFEETINIDLPLWVYFQDIDQQGNLHQVTVEVARQAP